MQVLDFFNSRMDMQHMDGEWSVDKVLQVIIINSRSWHGDGMKVKFKYDFAKNIYIFRFLNEKSLNKYS